MSLNLISQKLQNHQKKSILLIDYVLTISINNLSKKDITIVNLPYNIITTLILNGYFVLIN